MKNKIEFFTLLLICGYSKYVYSFTDTYGAGVRSNSMGRAFTAIADDFSAAYYNPAGLAQHRGHKLTIEYLYSVPDLEVKTFDGEDLIVRDKYGHILNYPVDGFAGSNKIRSPIIGLELDINEIIDPIIHVRPNIQACFYIAMAKNGRSPFTMVAETPDIPHFIAFGDSVDHLTSILSVGTELYKDIFYLGFGGVIIASSSTEMIGPELRINGENDSILHGYVGTETLFHPIIGILFTPFDKKIRIGFSYKKENYSKLEPLQLTGEIDAGFGIVPLTVRSFATIGYLPPEYNIGIAYDSRVFLVSMDIHIQKWSDFEYNRVYSYWITPDNPTLVDGTVSGPDFQDTTEYRFGVKYKINKNIDIMAGYFKEVTPVPDQSGRLTNYLDMDRDIYSIGGTFKFKKLPLTFSCGITYMTFKGFTVNNDGVKGISWGWEEGYYQESFKVSSGDVTSVNAGLELTF